MPQVFGVYGFGAAFTFVYILSLRTVNFKWSGKKFTVWVSKKVLPLVLTKPFVCSIILVERHR